MISLQQYLKPMLLFTTIWMCIFYTYNGISTLYAAENITNITNSDDNKTLLEDINIQILSKDEIKVYLKFSGKTLPKAPLVNKQNNLLKISFADSYIKLDDDVISVNQNILTNIKIDQVKSDLNLIFAGKPDMYYTIKNTKEVYLITIMSGDKLSEMVKTNNTDKNSKNKKISEQKNESKSRAKDKQVRSAKSSPPMSKSRANKRSGKTYKSPMINTLDFGLTEEKTAKITLGFNTDKIKMTIDDSKNNDNQLMLIFKNINLLKKINKIYDVGDFGTLVKTLRWDQDKKSNRLVFTINNTKPVDYVAYQLNNKLIIEVKDKFRSKDNTIFSKDYTGKKISLNFQDIELRSVLQLISDFTDLNLVASDSVQGNISLRLMDVPWDQALDIILKTKNLDKRLFGNILMIAPSNEIFELEKAELESEQFLEQLVRLETAYFNLNYAKAEDIFKLISSGNQGSVLSSRGKASYDVRTNLIIVQDTPNRLKEINEVIKKLDSSVKQVLIEARIVKADTNFQKELGVRWGLSAKRSSKDYQIGIGDTSPNATGVLTGGSVISPETRAAGETRNSDTGFNIDLGLADPSGIIGLALAKLPGKTLVHLELSALEAENMLETISSPKVITANKVPARIEQGQEIPYQEASSSGATSVSFKKAVLSLTVTPQITPDNKIIMDLNVTNDTADLDNPLANGVPVINTQEVETQVLVDNGQTLVLGGIYTQGLTNSVERIPFLGELPFVGQLFRQDTKRDVRSEFLIFITPKIVTEKYS